MIGFYDSGIGGFSILKEVLKTIPNLGFKYLADTEILPLGNKSPDFIKKRVKKACSFLFKNDCNLIILACNTAAVNSIREIQQNWLSKNYPGNQVLSISKPLIEELVEKDLRNQKGLLIATKSTIESNFYQQEIKKNGYTNIQYLSCLNLAYLIENENSEQSENIKKEFQNLKNKDQIEFLILACTHYCFAEKEILKSFKEKTKVIDPAKSVAKKLKIYLEKHPKYSFFDKESSFFTTSDIFSFKQKIAYFLPGKENLNINLIKL